MTVSDPLAPNLLRAFAQLEFRLKEIPDYLRAGRHRMAQVNWTAVERAVSQLPASRFLDRISDETKAKILTGARDRPMVQEVEVVGGQNVPVFKRLPLESPFDAGMLVEAARRVRNNLFHGGKEPDDRGDDDEWAQAALEIAEHLHGLLDRGELLPVQAP